MSKNSRVFCLFNFYVFVFMLRLTVIKPIGNTYGEIVVIYARAPAIEIRYHARQSHVYTIAGFHAWILAIKINR